MNKIKYLSPEQAGKIAAGEVIDRPAHVVKELLENALDAGATAITVYLEKAGKHLIRVIDNGCGMSADDAKLCFAHHATSKINDVNDLATLTTFGFRGEALASIAAVSTVTLVTKQATDAHGICVVRSGLDTLSVTEKACNTGTDITIQDLFIHVPVRKKFLRTDETEWSHIQQLFYAMALSQRPVHFKLYLDGVLRYNCPPATSIKIRLEQLWGYELYTLHDIGVHRNGVTLEGAITDTHHLRYDRSHMYLFVNHRWIKNPSLLRAWLQGYQNILPVGKYPAGVLHITLDPQVIDVNIHPRKEEIQLLYPRVVEQAITHAIKEALSHALQEHMERVVTPTFVPLSAHTPLSEPLPPTASLTQPLSSSIPFTEAGAMPAMPFPEPHPVQMPVHTSVITPTYTIVGQLHTTYILLETDDGLLLVDQHAAHERILYQRLKTGFESLASVPLLFPALVQITQAEVQQLEPHLALFAQVGMELRVLGAAHISVVACPVMCKELDWSELIRHVLSWIAQERDLSVQEMHETLLFRLRAQMACKSAVKAGDPLNQEQMQQLIKDLYHCDEHLTCPHGRPTTWLLAQYEIQKKFKRDYQR